MAQSDQVVQNATFPTVRADINDNLAALYSQSSGNTAPTVTVAFQPWIDTSSSPPIKKIRNGSNSAWITEGVLDPAAFQVGGITPIANGGTGTTTAALALTALLPSQTGNTGKSLVTDGSAASWTTISGITSGTAVASTSGTSIDFISIPAGVKRVTVMFNGVSTNGSASVMVQLGTASSFETASYVGSSSFIAFGTAGARSFADVTTAGFFFFNSVTAADLRDGQLTLLLLDSATNTWSANGAVGTRGQLQSFVSGSKALSGVLTRVRVTTTNGTDTFDAGAINILYET
jgi:hypothetical protein